VYKGTNPEIDSYSAFWDNMKLSKTSLDDQLRERSVTDVYVVGLATDVCVGTFYLMIKTKFLSYFETLFKLLQQCMLLKITIELY
jgi:nicotinamidase-related amidase